MPISVKSWLQGYIIERMLKFKVSRVYIYRNDDSSIITCLGRDLMMEPEGG